MAIKRWFEKLHFCWIGNPKNTYGIGQVAKWLNAKPTPSTCLLALQLYIWCLKKLSGSAFRRFFLRQKCCRLLCFFVCFWKIQVVHAALFLLASIYGQPRLNHMLPWLCSSSKSAKTDGKMDSSRQAETSKSMAGQPNPPPLTYTHPQK